MSSTDGVGTLFTNKLTLLVLSTYFSLDPIDYRHFLLIVHLLLSTDL